MELTGHASDPPAPAGRPGDEPDGRNPAALVVAAVDATLGLARTWLGWDGRPRVDREGRRIYTPHKAIRRTADHIVDHLAEVEALLAGEPTAEDRWFASTVTVAADWAPFTEADLVEAEQRLRRLARTFELRYAAMDPAEWDRPRDPNWTLRHIAEHVGTAWYAEQVGNLDA
ncbi:MAG TPA: hypothetical protein VKD21_13100 [Acidimicrobiales bacterium]|nr:hypothetical protein [Acidimicrobiales bacterium]